MVFSEPDLFRDCVRRLNAATTKQVQKAMAQLMFILCVMLCSL